MIEAHLQKLRARDTISEEEEQAIRRLVADVIDVQQDRIVIHEDEQLHHSILLLSGWMARAKILPSGERQLAELHVTGDFADLHGFTLKRLDHDLVSMSRCRLGIVPHERVKELIDRFPHLGRVYWLMTNIDAAIQREWTVSVGSRSAISRIAHLFCELDVRLGVVDLAENNSYDFPLTQVELGECLGLTSVHVNRTLQELRRRGLLELQNRRLTICDFEGLKEVAEFDSGYLYLEKQPR